MKRPDKTRIIDSELQLYLDDNCSYSGMANVSAFLLLEPETMSIGTDEHYNKFDGFALIIITKTIAMNLGEREMRNLRTEQLVSILGTIAALAALYFIA